MRYTAFYSETAVYRLTGPIIKSKLYFCVFLPRVCHLNFNITCTHSLIPFYFRCDKLWKLKNFYSLFIASNNFCGIQLLLIRNVDVWKGFMRERHDRTMVNNQLLRNWELKKKSEMIFRKCPMSWIFSLAVISLTEGISYGQDQCPEENRNRFLKSKQHLYKKKQN